MLTRSLSNIGSGNTAIGTQALLNNALSTLNTATGISALFSNTTGDNNTANGAFALFANTSGDNNTATGLQALRNTTGDNNTALGFQAGDNVTTANNVICIGAGVDGANIDNSCFIGNIFGQTVDPATGTAVFVDEAGKLGTIVSSKQFKDEIKPMDKASEAILELQPVTFRYKKELDPKGIQQFGLIAEDVAEVNPQFGDSRPRRGNQDGTL